MSFFASQVQLEKAKYKRSLEREKKDKDILQQIINQERMRVVQITIIKFLSFVLCLLYSLF